MRQKALIIGGGIAGLCTGVYLQKNGFEMEGWMLTPSTGFRQLPPVLPRLTGSYMAGQWLSPGGGLPSGLLSARAVSKRI